MVTRTVLMSSGQTYIPTKQRTKNGAMSQKNRDGRLEDSVNFLVAGS